MRIRSDAVFVDDNVENVLGHADTGGCVVASGPLKDDAINGGPGFAIRVRDVSATVVRDWVRSLRGAPAGGRPSSTSRSTAALAASWRR